MYLTYFLIIQYKSDGNPTTVVVDGKTFTARGGGG